MSSSEFVHQQLIQEEGINPANLPNEIKKKIRGWEIVFKRWEQNQEDEKSFKTLTIQSLEIADKIQDFIEKEYEEEDDDSDKNDDSDENNADKKDDQPKGGNEPKKDDQPKGGNEPKQPSTQNRDKRFGNLVMEKKILAITTQNNNRISVNQLEQIIGVEPDYPEQQVHNIRLRKVFMASYYRVL